MFGTLNSVGVQCQGPVAVGWLTHLYLIPCKNVAADLQPSTSLTALSAVWLTSEKVVTEIKLRSKTAGFGENMQLTADGETYSQQITIPIPAIANDLIDWVFKNANKRMVAIFRDTAGNCYMAGTKNNGLRMTWNRAVQNVSAQQLQLTGISWHPVVWLGTVNPDVLFPTREFDYSFDISFN